MEVDILERVEAVKGKVTRGCGWTSPRSGRWGQATGLDGHVTTGSPATTTGVEFASYSSPPPGTLIVCPMFSASVKFIKVHRSCTESKLMFGEVSITHSSLLKVDAYDSSGACDKD